VAREPVDLGVVVRDVASDLRVVAPDRVVTVAAPEALVVTGDRDRLTQALVGLTSNAVRHTPAGTPVWLSVVELPGSVRIDVADAGPGIPPEHLPHVFERFHRVDRGRSSSSGGTGLGLAIVAAIARAHGGSASVASQLGHGSTFSITLPAQADHRLWTTCRECQPHGIRLVVQDSGSQGPAVASWRSCGGTGVHRRPPRRPHQP
jgi:two-component system, OmpR family, sensor kinase